VPSVYDSHEDLIRAMNLPAAFDEKGYEEIGYYCRLRERHRGVTIARLGVWDYDYAIGDVTLDIPDKGEFLDRFGNSGESAYIDHVQLDRQRSDGKSV